MQREMPTTYHEALEYLYSFFDSERYAVPDPQAFAGNLPRTYALLAAVGNPQMHMPSVVVAGTKGKGSTSAIVESMARAAGYRTGMWISPHLNSYRERIQVNRELMSQDAMLDAVQRMHPIVAAFDPEPYGMPTVFELSFALALRFFAEQQVQLAVLEVGLGGLYDCANTVTPLVSLISSISYDHVDMLGRTLTDISRNKAGIMKAGVPVVTVSQHPESMAVLEHVAAEINAPLWVAAEDGLYSGTQTPVAQPYPVAPIPALRGQFQRENARLALSATMLLRDRGVAISDEAMAQGLATVQWPGRLEVVRESPLIVLDGAHNGDSAQKLMAALQEEFCYNRMLLILSISRNKQIDAILSALVPQASLLILTRLGSQRAYADLDQVAALAQPYLNAPPILTADAAEALALAQAQAQPDDLICVTGSLFLVGAAREALGMATDCD